MGSQARKGWRPEARRPTKSRERLETEDTPAPYPLLHPHPPEGPRLSPRDQSTTKQIQYEDPRPSSGFFFRPPCQQVREQTGEGGARDPHVPGAPARHRRGRASGPAGDRGRGLSSAPRDWSNRVTSKRLFLSHASTSLLWFSDILSSRKSSLEAWPVSFLLAPSPS